MKGFMWGLFLSYFFSSAVYADNHSQPLNKNAYLTSKSGCMMCHTSASLPTQAQPPQKAKNKNNDLPTKK